MTQRSRGLQGYIEEFRHRKVFQVAAVYAVGAWLLMQVADATFEPLNLPPWAATLVLWLLILGFPVALILAWALEVTPEGVRKTRKKAKPAGGSKADDESVPSIAVLPFADMSPGKDQDHFCEGMAEEIINTLAKIGGVHVASRTASFQFKGAATDIALIGEQLNVSTILEGSVRKAEGKLRVTAQLINVEDGYHLWSEGYDRDLEDVFGIQKEIAENVAGAFKLTLSPREEQAIESRPTENVEAYDFYLRGRKYFYQHRRQAFEYAREMFSRAIELDQDYALAYAGLADCFSLLYMYAESSASNRLQAETNSRLALQLDPNLAQAHTSRGLALSLSHRYDEAEKAFERATELDPKLFEAYYFYARDAFAQGKLEKAAELFERACEVRPEDYQAPALLAQVYHALGRDEDRNAIRQKTLEIVQRRLERKPDDARALYLGAGSLVDIGRSDEAVRWAERALSTDPEDALILYNVACVFARAGADERALDCLEKSVSKGMAQREWIEHDTDLDSLRDEPRFRALLS